MSLAILSDDQIRVLLESLSRDEAETLLEKLRSALHEYSTGQQHVDAGLLHQPERTVIHSKVTGATTLFMPSANVDGHAVKGQLRMPTFFSIFYYYKEANIYTSCNALWP